jgi:hypothetical protein
MKRIEQNKRDGLLQVRPFELPSSGGRYGWRGAVLVAGTSLAGNRNAMYSPV